MNKFLTHSQSVDYIFLSIASLFRSNERSFFVFFYFVQYFCMNVNTSNDLQTILKFQIFITKNEKKKC